MQETSLFVSRVLADAADGEEEEHFGVHISYVDLYACIVFFAAIYAAGVLSVRLLGLPALVGEIFTGILLGPNLANIVPNVESFVMLGEIGLILLVLEAGIDIDLTTLKLIGGRGLMIALVGTFLPILIAFAVAHFLGYSGVTAVAAGCTFAPTSLGIAMNVLRRAQLVNTPVGQLIVAAAIIDDMVALVILSQLQAFADGDFSIGKVLTPVASALGFLIIGGYLAVFVLPGILDKTILDHIGPNSSLSRGWVSILIMFVLLLLLVPATYFCKASPLMGAFLAGLVFCSSAEVHHMFVSQFKRVMQWLLRIFMAASIGFQVPIQQFGNATVLLQGLAFSTALLGKVAVGFMVPKFASKTRFQGIHLRNCLVVGFSMAAEGEFAFVIAVFGVSHNMITQELYASVVLAVLLSIFLAPFFLRCSISYFNRQIESAVYGSSGHVSDSGLHISAENAIFFCIQTKSAPSWGIQSDIMEELAELQLDVIDHRSWHPRQSNAVLVNELYIKDTEEYLNRQDTIETDKMISNRIESIKQGLAKAIDQPDAAIKVKRWIPVLPQNASEKVISQRIVHATGAALESSMKQHKRQDEAYVIMEEEDGCKLDRQMSHLDLQSEGRLNGFFRHDRQGPVLCPTASEDGLGIELLDVHGVGTGRYETREEYGVYGELYGASMT